MKRKKMEQKELERQERFEQQRIKTIELLNPAFIHEIRACANTVDMTFDEFLEVLHAAVEDEEYYVGMGNNEDYRTHDWNKIWAGYELLTGKKVPPSRWCGPRVPFSCSC